MLIANILKTLEQSSLSKATMTIQNVNGVPSLILSFVSDSVTATDSDKVMELRKLLASPLVVTGQDLEIQLTEHLAHSFDDLLSTTKEIKKAQQVKVNKKANVSKVTKNVEKKSKVNPEPAQQHPQDTHKDNNSSIEISQISMSDFSL